MSMKIQAVKPFTVRDATYGTLTSYAAGEIATVDDTPGAAYISAGLATQYTLLTPTGNKAITENGTDIDVAAYATVSVAVP